MGENILEWQYVLSAVKAASVRANTLRTNTGKSGMNSCRDYKTALFAKFKGENAKILTHVKKIVWNCIALASPFFVLLQFCNYLCITSDKKPC